MMVVGISAVGAVTAVGEDAPATVGSIFTGAQAFKRLPVDLPDGRPIAGAVTPISSDVKGADRIAMLTAVALKEATRSVVPETEIGLVFCTPFEGIDVEVDGRGGQFLKGVAREAGVLVDEKVCRMVPVGLSGLVEAMTFAEKALYSGDLAAVCIVAADSLSTQPRLGRLLRGEAWERGRPIPGEAGAALLLTRQIGSGSLAILAGVGVSEAPAVTMNRPTATAKRSLAAIEAAISRQRWLTSSFRPEFRWRWCTICHQRRQEAKNCFGSNRPLHSSPIVTRWFCHPRRRLARRAPRVASSRS